MIFGVLDQSAQFSILPNDIHSGKRVDDGMLMQIHMSRKCLQTYMFEGKGDILYCLLLESLQATMVVTKPIRFKFPLCILSLPTHVFRIWFFDTSDRIKLQRTCKHLYLVHGIGSIPKFVDEIWI